MSASHPSDRRWMAKAESLDRQDHGFAMGNIYYGGGGVYRVCWGSRVRGASEARKFIEKHDPVFARRVSLAARQTDRTNGVSLASRGDA